MGLYSDLTDAELAALITQYRQARSAIILGGAGGVGAVKRVTDGDRTVEYTSANLRDLDKELQALLDEQARRSDPYGRGAGKAIRVEFD